MRSLEDLTAGWRGALVFVGDSVRPAAFVFDVPGGFAWIEPSYSDPAGAASPALHQRTGAMIEAGAGFMCGEATVLPYEPDDTDLVGDALEWFAQHLQGKGASWESERQAVRELAGL